MTENPKKTGADLKGFQFQPENNEAKGLKRFFLLIANSKTVVPLLSAIIQIFTGMALVAITILGLVTPLWLSAVLSILGSITAMLGGFLIYYTMASQETFDSLINKAIRRVIRSQN